jgi:hypothetical protein
MPAFARRQADTHIFRCAFAIFSPDISSFHFAITLIIFAITPQADADPLMAISPLFSLAIFLFIISFLRHY